jgi:hypothetical protein
MSEQVSGVRFRQSAIHFREISRAELERGEVALVVACPRCWMEFFTAVPPVAPGDREEAVRSYPAVRRTLLRARVMLQEHCPDHAHTFEVDPDHRA